MNTDTVVSRARLDTSVADALVEALATTSHLDDPFHQAAAVAEHLWDEGIVLERSSTTFARMILTGSLLLLVIICIEAILL